MTRPTSRTPPIRPPLALLCLTLPLLPSCGDDAAAAVDASLIHTVTRSDMAIRVREQGELEAAKNTTVVSQVEGTTRLIYLIPQGTKVQAGDKLAELDASSLREKRAVQAISVAKALATKEQASKRVAILEKEIRAAENTASSRLEIALLREQKLLGHRRTGKRSSTAGTNAEMIDKLAELIESDGADDPSSRSRHAHLLNSARDLLGGAANHELEMGEMANQILQVVDAIALARVDLKLSMETLVHSRRLRGKDFITQNELEKDEINYKRQLSKVTLSWNNLQLLLQYTIPELKIERQQEVENARLGLQSVQATNEANRVREHAELESATAEYALAKERLDNLDEQIANSIVRAPSQGEVVYAYQRRSRGWVREGEDIDQRQAIVYLPDPREMVVRMMVHEAQINKVAVGQHATVRVDAFPGEVLTGEVVEVSSLPDASARYGNRNLRLYKVLIGLSRRNEDFTMRPGMTASVDIQCGVLEDVVHIPMIALHRRGNRSYVFKETPEGPRPEPLDFGASNLTQVQVVAGLEPGDRIYLVQPPGVLLPKAPPEDAEQRVEADGAAAEAAKADGATAAKESSAANGSATGAAAEGREQDGNGK